MTAPKQEPGNAVAVREQGREQMRKALSPDAQRKLDEVRARNHIVQQIRGAMWAKDISENVMRSIAEYCRQNQIDAVRHVELLGGRIYLTAEFYDERGAWLIRDGIVQPLEPDYIHADPRLDKLAEKGDEWAKNEIVRRERARIQFAAPEAAKAICVQRFRITQTGAIVTGVNWCGAGGTKRDPVGDAEPTKTAATRARRRAWKQIADVIPAYAAVVQPIEANARALAPIATVDAPRQIGTDATHRTNAVAGLPFGVVTEVRSPVADASSDYSDAQRHVAGQAADGDLTDEEQLAEEDERGR